MTNNEAAGLPFNLFTDMVDRVDDESLNMRLSTTEQRDFVARAASSALARYRAEQEEAARPAQEASRPAAAWEAGFDTPAGWMSRN